MSKRLNKVQKDTLAHRLAQLLATEMDINAIFTNWTDLGEQEKSDVINATAEFLIRAQAIASEFKARDFTVVEELGWPPKVSVSFTWSTPVSE